MGVEKPSFEPGLLQAFQVFIGGRIALRVLQAFTQALRPEQPMPRVAWLVFLELGVLMGYLAWPWLRSRLGRAYLPIALVAASAGPIVEQSLSVNLRQIGNQAEASTAAGEWQLILVLFVPAILVAWQYDFRHVIAYCLGTIALDLALAVPLAAVGGRDLDTAIRAMLVRTIMFGLVGFMVSRLMTGQRRQRAALALANARLEHYATTLEQLAVSRERNRLARELHDVLAHSLSALAVQLEAVNALWEGNPSEARAILNDSLAGTHDGLKEARRAIAALRAAPLEDLGLALALRNLAETTAARASLALDLQVPDRTLGLPLNVDQVVYRIASEAMSNVVQHARAQHLRVRLDQRNGRLTLEVSDDGGGFEPNPPTPEGHYGLQGMREHAAMVAGTLSVVSQPGQGTTVQLAVEVDGDASVDL